MNNKRREIKEHISAARDWLGRAETSLDKENDVRGDLDVMLAQAELQRVQEAKNSIGWRRLFIRFAPLAVAIVVAFGYLMLLHSEKAGNSAGTAPAVTAQDKAAAEVNKTEPAKSIKDDGMTGKSSSLEVVATVPKEDSELSVQEPVAEKQQTRLEQPKNPEEKIMEAPLAKKEDAPAAERPLEKVRTIPAAQLQELMHRAGKSLRE